ncbi:hypothetical protein PoB_001155800 [Plakobranchus ocellatus]|uniref:Uncharacterized protein n=1 Tax=Plakobranchus ocellatus TaxID=259542 RepID=A0AAV3YR65_9GAST|nr:hypothetical protein PoB_001155800 [Plakobranchus ocellatus]
MLTDATGPYAYDLDMPQSRNGHSVSEQCNKCPQVLMDPLAVIQQGQQNQWTTSMSPSIFNIVEREINRNGMITCQGERQSFQTACTCIYHWSNVCITTQEDDARHVNSPLL